MKDFQRIRGRRVRSESVSLYAETKVAVETALLRGGCNGNDWCPTPLRFATVYGVSPRMRFDLTVNEFTMEMLNQEAPYCIWRAVLATLRARA